MKNNKTKSFKLDALSFNAGLLIKELLKRNIKVSQIGHTIVVKARYGAHEELLYDVHSSLLSYPEGWIINDKFYSKKWLEHNGFSIAKGQAFTYQQSREAIRYASKIKYPVVLKPTVGSHGDFVWVDIKSDAELEEKINGMKKKSVGNGYVLIEKYFLGNEYRLFVSKTGFFAAVWRIPANVIGDGKNNLLMLIERENKRRMNPRINCLCEIKLDEITFDFMERNNITIDFVPKKGEVVNIRNNSNVSTGGNCYDVTDSVHKSVWDMAQKILATFPNALYMGIDLLCKSIAKPLTIKNHIICELNSAPGLSLHMMPEKGKPQNVAKELVNLLFPETIHEKNN